MESRSRRNKWCQLRRDKQAAQRESVRERLSRAVCCVRPFLKKEIVDKAESAQTMGN
jgi:hypothetical protein